MTENPERLRQRNKLLLERERLVAAQELLEQVLGDRSGQRPTANTDREMRDHGFPSTPRRQLVERGRGSGSASAKRKSNANSTHINGSGNLFQTPTKKLCVGLAGT